MNFKEEYGDWAIVAGATEGIGLQFSLQLAAKGLNLLLIARGQEGLDNTVNLINEKHPEVETRCLSQDLSDPDLKNKIKSFAGDRKVGLVICNAVYSYIGNFLEDEQESRNLSIDINCRAPLAFVDTFIGPMVERNKGGIVLVSSMSGFQGSAMVSTYAATKAFITVLAEGLWEELKPHGVHVMTCVAGATLTPNFEKQTPKEKVSSVMPMAPSDVVKEAIKALEKKQGPTVIAGKMNRFVYFLFSKLFSRKKAVSFISSATRKLYQE